MKFQHLCVVLLVVWCAVMLVDRLISPTDEAGVAKAVASVVTAKQWQITVLPKVGQGEAVSFAITDGVTSYNLVVPGGHPANADFRTLSGRQKFIPCECMGGSSILPSAYFAPDTPAVRAKLRLANAAD